MTVVNKFRDVHLALLLEDSEPEPSDSPLHCIICGTGCPASLPHVSYSRYWNLLIFSVIDTLKNLQQHFC